MLNDLLYIKKIIFVSQRAKPYFTVKSNRYKMVQTHFQKSLLMLQLINKFLKKV